MRPNNWRWVNDWRGLHLKRVWVDEYPKEGDFELPELTSKKQIEWIEKMGPGIKSWVYIKYLKFKY